MGDVALVHKAKQSHKTQADLSCFPGLTGESASERSWKIKAVETGLEWTFEAAVNKPYMMLASHARVPGFETCFQLPANAYPGR